MVIPGQFRSFTPEYVSNKGVLISETKSIEIKQVRFFVAYIRMRPVLEILFKRIAFIIFHCLK